MPRPKVKSKEADLARVRRNQQRCRDRKRSHIESLEQQIRDLEAQISNGAQREPLTSGDNRSDQVPELMRENAALRRLLTAMGFDAHSQRTYLASSAKRDAVDAVLKDGAEVAQRLQLEAENDDVLSPAQDANSSWPTSRNDETSLVPASLSSPRHLDRSAAMNDLVLQQDRWLDVWASPTAALSGTFEMAAYGSDILWPGFDAQTMAQMSPDATVRNSSSTSQGQSTGTGIDDIPSEAYSCCSMDAATPSSNPQTSTVCSVALSVVFRHNNGRLTPEELTRRMRSGFRKAPEPSQECRVENHTLFRVLAELGT